ncbi:MAG TPA: alpha/beta fold hydrolase [Eubacteriales bacterium]|nr:alpha/beta fold hydrolase [Eubacteriales bacterium]
MQSEPGFKSEESKRRIRARYAEILANFPFRQRYAETSIGETFALEAGGQNEQTVILLHGSCSNSAFWFMEMGALSTKYHVFALDIPGEAGNSAAVRLDMNSGAYADWLWEAMNALGVTRAALIGNSLGGWAALKFAVTRPQAVERLALISPSGLSGANAALLKKAERAKTQGDAVAFGAATALPKPVLEFIELILSGYNPLTQEPPVFPDCELERLTMPVLLIAGENDDVVDAPQAAKRLGRAVPHAQIHLRKGAGHIIADALTELAPFFGLNG